ncbi:ABC transporter permease [Psychroflexus planctonicus]|uniref:ABC transporter permease n=1 Tax=Psychroflexus planctonicus TaxID=1526575 RepID=UPI001668CBE5|nr:iron ABC transporter permease [Psychroflexus planctonicus]
MKQAGNRNINSFLDSFFKLKRDINRWSIATLFILLLIAVPVLTISVKLFDGPGESWSHISTYLLPSYLENSLYLALLCSLLTILFGVSSAWLVTRYHFPLRKVLEWLLIIPLAIPSYIVAYAYAGFLDYGGVYSIFMEVFGVTQAKFDIMNVFGLAFVLSISLFPYVYVSSRAFFLNQAVNLLEASRLLGVSERKSFVKLILPLARPAIVAGLVLVIMEVLNDYGAAQYFGVNTFTTGIFRSWFSLEEPETAIYLSALLLILVFGLILIEKWQRRKIQYSSVKSTNTKTNKRIVLPKFQQFIISLVVIIPVVLGFFIPVLQLLIWAYKTVDKVMNQSLFWLSLQSFGIAFVTAFFTVFFALILLYFSKWNKITLVQNAAKLGVLGYAIPGAVVAIGVMIPTLFLDKWFITEGFATQFVINGTLIALVYAYVVRFLAVAYQPLESSSLKVSDSIPDSSKILGMGNFKTFIKIEFPLIRAGMLSAFILVFIDTLKELPLTLILKPYHINTLAVKAYEFASDEMVMHAAIPSLFIILTALIPVVFLNKLLLKNE